MVGRSVGFTNKEKINVAGMDSNVKELAGLDSFKITGAMLFEQVDNTTGQVQGAFALKTDVGIRVGIAKNVYNAVDAMLGVYGKKEFLAGIEAKIVSSDTDSDRAYLHLELL